MPIIHANIIRGRERRKIVQFAEAVTQAAVDHLDVRPEQVRVLVNEVDAQNWFTAGNSKAPVA